MTDKSKQAEPKASVKALKIRSIAPQGHRRAGRRWPAQATVVPAAELDEGQLAALRSDQRLVVEETDVKGSAAKATGDEGTGADA